MKTQIIMLTALVAVALVLAGMQFVVAEDNVSEDAEPVLISADSDADLSVSDAESELDESENVGAVGMGLKQMGVWFTFNQEKKAQKELQLAKLQLIRAKIAAKNNNTAAMEKALEAHERIMNRVQTRVEKISKAGNAAEKYVALSRSIAVHEARIQRLNGVLENANLTEAQRIKVEARLQHVENVTAGLKNVQAKVQQKVQELKDQAVAENKTVRQVVNENRQEIRDAVRNAGNN